MISSVVRQRLTGQDVAGVELALFQCVVAAHGRLACDDLRTAGAADAALAGERQVRPDLLGAVEDRRARREAQRRAAPVEDDGQAGALARRAASSWTASAGGSSPTQNSSRWIRPGSTPSPRSTSIAPVTIAIRPAQPPVVHRGHVDGRGQQRGQPRGVEPPAVQLDLLRLAGQHVDDLHPGRVGVLEVRDLVGEHDRVAAPVAVQQRHGGLVVRRQDRRGDRHHRGDAGPRGDQHVAAGDAQVGGEGAARRLHLKRVAGPERVHQPAGDRAARDLADADPRCRSRPARRSSSCAAPRRGGRSATARPRTRTRRPGRRGR